VGGFELIVGGFELIAGEFKHLGTFICLSLEMAKDVLDVVEMKVKYSREVVLGPRDGLQASNPPPPYCVSICITCVIVAVPDFLFLHMTSGITILLTYLHNPVLLERRNGPIYVVDLSLYFISLRI
jgi:hypothetical protein